MAWLSGYYTGEDDEAVIDFDKIAAGGQKLSAYFAQNPSMTLLTAAESIISKQKRGLNRVKANACFEQPVDRQSAPNGRRRPYNCGGRGGIS